ncbi:MAG TPA: PspC domain-containing protein [Allosphingosinicella sp.]|nr:PspC domain-containing protein [Allosphingosinicella sp.]
MNTGFALDKTNGKMMGVCAGLSRSTGVDVTILRIGAVIVTVCLTGLTIPIYLVAGFVAPGQG